MRILLIELGMVGGVASRSLARAWGRSAEPVQDLTGLGSTSVSGSAVIACESTRAGSR